MATNNNVMLTFTDECKLLWIHRKYIACSTTIVDSIVAYNGSACEMAPVSFATFKAIRTWIKHHKDELGRDLVGIDEVPFDEWEQDFAMKMHDEGMLLDMTISADWLNIKALHKTCCKAMPLAYNNANEELCLKYLKITE